MERMGDPVRVHALDQVAEAPARIASTMWSRSSEAVSTTTDASGRRRGDLAHHPDPAAGHEEVHQAYLRPLTQAALDRGVGIPSSAVTSKPAPSRSRRRAVRDRGSSSARTMASLRSLGSASHRRTNGCSSSKLPRSGAPARFIGGVSPGARGKSIPGSGSCRRLAEAPAPRGSSGRAPAHPARCRRRR